MPTAQRTRKQTRKHQIQLAREAQVSRQAPEVHEQLLGVAQASRSNRRVLPERVGLGGQLLWQCIDGQLGATPAGAQLMSAVRLVLSAEPAAADLGSCRSGE